MTPEDIRSSFGAAFSRDALAFLIKDRSLPGSGIDPERERLEGVAQSAVMDIFRRLSAEGVLREIPDTHGHQIRFVQRWNGVIRGNFDCRWNGKDGVIAELASHLAWGWLFMAAMTAAKRLKDGEPEHAVLDRAYDELLDLVSAGNTTVGSPLEAYCEIDDVTYHAHFADWSPRLIGYDRVTRQRFPIAPISVDELDSVQVQLETGNLLIADWFRLPGFTELYKDIDIGGRSIGSVVGRRQRTRLLAEQGVISVEVGNTSPAVFAIDEEIVVGRYDDDVGESDDPVTPIGATCTDFWWVTAVERERLTRIVMSAEGCDEDRAGILIDDYIAKYGVVSVSVPAGLVTVHFAGDHDRFADAFTAEELVVPGNVEPFFVITPRALTLIGDRHAAPIPGPK